MDSALSEPQTKAPRLEEDDQPEDLHSKYIQAPQLKALLKHIGDMLGFKEQAVSEDDFYAQYAPVQDNALPMHDVIKSMILKDWKDVDKQSIPRFLRKRYVLEGFEDNFPQTPKVNTILASMSSSSSLASEDSVLTDANDKKVDSALKRCYAASNYAARANTYAAYETQVVLKDFYALSECLQAKEDPSSLLANVELLAQFQSDSTFDSLWAASTVAGAAVTGSRALWLKSWKLESVQRALLYKLPFLGQKLFGPDLDTLIQKAVDEKKLLQPFKSFAAKKPFLS